MEPQTHRFTWQVIEIEAIYEPVSWSGMAHLQIRSIAPERAPLPITETGYLSHFCEAGEIEANGISVVEQVIAYLDHEAAKPEWRRYIESSRQLSLF